MKANFLISAILLMTSLTSCCWLSGDCDEKTRGCTSRASFNYNPTANEDDGSCRSMIGCVGYAQGMTNSGSLGLTLGNQYYDQKMIEEVAIQASFYNGIPASVYILYETAPEYKNAYATPDGQILFGYYMFYYTIQTYGELPVAGILAHEWGHRTQFTYGWNSGVPGQELEADAFSGYYMAMAKQWAWSQIQSYYANIYALGDYNFNSPQHHGTNNQRLSAAYLGVTTAIGAMQNNIRYSYNDLHALFTSEIANKILKGPRMQTYAEVVYPENLTPEYLKSLFPKP